MSITELKIAIEKGKKRIDNPLLPAGLFERVYKNITSLEITLAHKTALNA